MDPEIQSESYCIKYPRTYDSKKWELFLERKLSAWEQNILNNANSERNFNRSMKVLYEACAKYNMYVPLLTKLDGNCLYESLAYHKIGSGDNYFRQGLAFIMYMFRNYENLLPGDRDTLLTKFTISNCGPEGTRYVGCKNNRKFYNYTYDVMCQDLTNDGSWSRIEPYLIFAVLSLLYRIEIVILTIIDNQCPKTVINVYQDCENKPEIKTIYIANINNFHYLPIDINYSQNKRKLYYNESHIEFKKWGLKSEKEKRDKYMKKN